MKLSTGTCPSAALPAERTTSFLSSLPVCWLPSPPLGARREESEGTCESLQTNSVGWAVLTSHPQVGRGRITRVRSG